MWGNKVTDVSHSDSRRKSGRRSDAKTPSKRPGLKYGAIALTLAVAMILSLQFVGPSDAQTEDGVVGINNYLGPVLADDNIDLNSPGTSTEYSFALGTITFNATANGNVYRLYQSSPVTINIVLLTGVDIGFLLDGVDITGSIELQGNAILEVWLDGANVIKNVPFEKDQRIFEAGVNYFR